MTGHQRNEYRKGEAAHTPLRTFALVDVEVYPVQFRPKGILTPEIGVHEDRRSFVFRRLTGGISKRCVFLPIESMAEMMPVLISRTGEVTKIA